MEEYITIIGGGLNPLLHDIYFVFADRLMGSDDLAVDIRQTDLVIVNEIKGATPLRARASTT